MKFKKVGQTRGDETAPYEVSDYRSKTVGEFITEVITCNPQEWGYIAVGGSFVLHPSCEYRCGKLLTTLDKDLLSKEILSVTADGGWSRMDYALIVKD